jgi:tRNA threonylcarbamoyladenosine biosynthesis protein TsaB
LGLLFFYDFLDKEMARILLLDTATEVCSAALSENGEVLSFKEKTDGFRHSELLTVFIGELLKEEGWSVEQLDAVCVSRGPGSYTGLRIGVSVAKGLCYGLNIPLIAVSSLHSMADHVAQNFQTWYSSGNAGILLCPMLDARRMEIYTALFDRFGKQVTGIKAEIIHAHSFSGELNSGKIFFFGNGSLKCKSVIKHPDAHFIDGITASARFMSSIARDSFISKEFENIAYFEPFYLKDFVATIPKNKVI